MSLFRSNHHKMGLSAVEYMVLADEMTDAEYYRMRALQSWEFHDHYMSAQARMSAKGFKKGAKSCNDAAISMMDSALTFSWAAANCEALGI